LPIRVIGRAWQSVLLALGLKATSRRAGRLGTPLVLTTLDRRELPGETVGGIFLAGMAVAGPANVGGLLAVRTQLRPAAPGQRALWAASSGP
jgi:hypothetical protein